jgi:alkaline phosphatase D
MFPFQRLDSMIRYEGGVSRRLFMAWGAALSGMATVSDRALGRVDSNPVFLSDPFTLGVASGDPDSSSVVLWTRLAPRPLEENYGMKPEAVEVSWELSEDEAFRKVVAHGKKVATPEFGHSVHVEVPGLSADRWYWYRFRASDAASPVGRTRTMPEKGSKPRELNFAFASCQHYEQGLFTAYSQMARDELDLVFHLGDYIYEYKGKDKLVRKHVGDEIMSLADYRRRHAQYRSDPLLSAAHARCPWVVTWDDHEFDNNYANEISEEKGVDPAEFLKRRANAYRAYYEAMPLRAASLPKGPDMLLYRKVSFGNLAEFQVLDTRQYRTDQPNNDKASPINAAALDPNGTLLGSRQKAWLKDGLAASPSVWNILAQQVMMGMATVGRKASELEGSFSMDQWPGYAAERMELARFLVEKKIANPVVLTGDIHSNWVNDLRVDDRKPESPVVAAEFVGTSISSGGKGKEKPEYLDRLLSANPFVKYHSTERGYVRCRVTPDRWQSDYVMVDDVTKPGGQVATRASFVIEAGRPGVNRA